jgi:hypothetical protein
MANGKIYRSKVLHIHLDDVRHSNIGGVWKRIIGMIELEQNLQLFKRSCHDDGTNKEVNNFVIQIQTNAFEVEAAL